MSTTPEASAQTPASEDSPVRLKLAAAAARAGARTPRARKTTARKTTPPAARSRNDRAAARGKYAARIAPAVKAGAALVGWKDPVAARVIQLRADDWAASLDAVAAEDPRVDAILARVSGWFGKGGAWGDFGKETALMVGGVLVAGGRVPLTGGAGMVLAMFAGGLVQQATNDVAQQLALQEWIAYGNDPDTFHPGNARVAEIAAQIIQVREDKAAARLIAVPDDDDAAPADDDEDAAPAPRRPFAAWAA